MRRSRWTPVPLLAGFALTATLLAGCGAEEDREGGMPAASPAAPSGPAEPSPTQVAPCAVLDADQVEALTGAEIRGGSPGATGQGLVECTWGSLEGTGVMAGRVPAGEWADAMPELFASIQEVDPADLPFSEQDLAELEEAAGLVESGGEVPDAEACDLWQSFAEIGGQPAGSTISVSLFPTTAAPEILAVQGCEDGVFATLTVARPDLADRVDRTAAAARRILVGLLAG